MGPDGLYRRWLVLVTAGELAGFAVPAFAGIWAVDRTAASALAWMPAAGLAEGFLLGASQAHVLRHSVPGFRPRRWILATSLAAALAWFLGMLPSSTHTLWSRWPEVWVVFAGVVLGSVLLTSIGTAQAIVLPRTVDKAWSWVGWTALGWCAGLTAFTALATPLWHEGQARWLTILIGLVAGLVMACTMAAVTGVGAIRLVERAGRPQMQTTAGRDRHYFSDLQGSTVCDEHGERVREVRDS